MKELEGLGLHSDGTVFSYVKEGKLHGLIVTKVDNRILAGDDIFEQEITE